MNGSGSKESGIGGYARIQPGAIKIKTAPIPATIRNARTGKPARTWRLMDLMAMGSPYPNATSLNAVPKPARVDLAKLAWCQARSDAGCMVGYQLDQGRRQAAPGYLKFNAAGGRISRLAIWGVR